MGIRNSREDYNSYMRVYHMKRYYRLKKLAFVYLGGKCKICGTKKNLEIDHVVHKSRKFCATRMLSYSAKIFWKELLKCQLLCRDHHREKTLRELGKKSAIGTHGTISSYKYCHCEKCRKAKREWTREYRKTHPRKYADVA